MARPRKEVTSPVPGFTDEFGSRLQSVISQVGTMEEAAVAAGASVDQLSSWKFGRSRPDFFALAKLCAAIGRSMNWLATGEEASDRPTLERQVVPKTRELGEAPVLQLVDPQTMQDGGLVLLPRYEVRGSAGTGLIAPGEELRDFVAFDVAYLRAAGIDPRQANLIQVEGRSMMPTLVDGEWVIVDTSATEVVTGYIYAVVYQGSLRIKRLRRERKVFTLISDNKAENYPDEMIEGPDLVDFRVVGRVRRHIRSL